MAFGHNSLDLTKKKYVSIGNLSLGLFLLNFLPGSITGINLYVPLHAKVSWNVSIPCFLWTVSFGFGFGVCFGEEAWECFLVFKFYLLNYTYIYWKSFQLLSLPSHWTEPTGWFWWDSMSVLHTGCSLALGTCADTLADFYFNSPAFLFSGMKMSQSVHKTASHCCCKNWTSAAESECK